MRQSPYVGMRPRAFEEFINRLQLRRYDGYETPGHVMAEFVFVNRYGCVQYKAYHYNAYRQTNPWIDGRGDGSIRVAPLVGVVFHQQFTEVTCVDHHISEYAHEYMRGRLLRNGETTEYFYLPVEQAFIVRIGEVVLQITFTPSKAERRAVL